jgi:DtxR family Mn-dependent transcriptional regulator
MPLSELGVGSRGQVLTISRACRGAERRRFLDLGLVPGTLVTPELRSPAGDPTAYRIREALIALRKEQARHVRVKALEVPA